MTSKSSSKKLEVEDYILKEDIGEGNFGKVKLGISKITGEKYAVKIINKDQIKIKMKNKIFRENEVITKFNHINVIFVFEIIEDQENYYIIMEYCKKGELFDYIVDRERLSEDEAAIFFYQLINGVEYIHSKGIAHRDLKPENLLLTKDKTLKIIDFGLSHEFDGINLLKTKCGSPSYASPEILRGKPYDGFKSDIWCCGIILYAMVCGYLPFDGDTNKILFKNILKCEPEIPDYLNDYTQDLIIRILTSDPNMRITIDEIKRHRFYLRGKKLCRIDYKLIEKNVLKKRKNKSSFKLNEDDNTYFIAENNLDFNDIKKQIISREEKLINEIINETKNNKKEKEENREKKGKNKEKIKEENNIINKNEEKNDINNKDDINNNIKETLSNMTIRNSSNDLNNPQRQSGYNNKVELNSLNDSNINDNNKSDSKKGPFKHFNNKNEMDEKFLGERLKTNYENINVKNNNNNMKLDNINNDKIEQIKTPKNKNINNYIDNNKKDKFNEFLQNIGKNLHINTNNNESKFKLLKFNKNNIDKNHETLDCKSPKIYMNKYNPTITINGNNNFNSIFNANDNRIFDKIKNNFNKNYCFNNNKRRIFFNTFKSGKNKNISNENSNNINNEMANENNNDIEYNNLNKNNIFKNKKSPDKISLNSINQIKLINLKPSNKDNHSLYYNNINININNINIKQGNHKTINDNFIPNLNYIKTDIQPKNKINKKYSITNFHNSKQLYLNTENNKQNLKIKKLSEENKEKYSKDIINNNYISKTDGIGNKKLASKTQVNFYKPKKYFNFDKISFRSTNNDKRLLNKKNKLQFKNNIEIDKNEKLSIRGGSEGRPIKHSTHLDRFLQTITANEFYKKRKGNKKIYFYGPINIKVNNNNYNVNHNPRHQFLPIMFKK